ncbi:MAG TPA: hypothetical protein VNQ52_00345 [Microbacteriaceae bacterium]|nr:hypothetical protein [Microbacteriaceae bacterium]
MNARRGVLAGALALGLVGAVVPVVTAAEPASACGGATVIHASFGFIWGMGSPEPAPTDVIFEATALGGDGSWSAWVRATALPTGIEGTFELGCLDTGTMYEFWFDVDVGHGQSYLYHVGTNYPNAFQGEVEQFPENPGWFTLDTRYPPVVVGAGLTTAPTDVIRVPTGGTAPLVIAPTTGLDRPVQLPASVPGTATLPGRDVVLAANGAQVTFFPGTVVTGPSDWNGQVMLPTAVAAPEPPEGAEAVVAVRVGAASGGLSFSRPARIVLLGQAGKTAAFALDGGALTPITAVCMSNDASGLGAAAECAIEDGDDLVIWTTHFTTFAAYSTSAAALPPTGQDLSSFALGAAAIGLLVGAVLVVLSRRRFATLEPDGRPRP